jgi:hypothetical protein
MSQLVKTKRQANFKDFKRFGAFKGLVEQKTLVILLQHRFIMIRNYLYKIDSREYIIFIILYYFL